MNASQIPNEAGPPVAVKSRSQRLTGALLGLAIGDALGLPYEGFSRRRGIRVLGEPNRYRFWCGWGMVSDDTEHACITVQAMIAGGKDGDIFLRQLAARIRWWLVSLPAGMGRASLRSAVRLWLGVSPRKSGVFSAGNGPCMRSGILGVAIDDLPRLRSFVRLSTRMSHTDPKAEVGALVIAWASRLATQHRCDPDQFLDFVKQQFADDAEPTWQAAADEMIQRLQEVVVSVKTNQPTIEFAVSMDCGDGVSGYTFHTVPIVIHLWLAHTDDFEAAVETAIRCGGDADTTAALVGGIIGAHIGDAQLPSQRLTRLLEWPRSVRWMRRLCQQLSEVVDADQPQTPPRLNPVALLARNLLFLAVVLIHALRRVFPPY